jgi:low affinity Fe/Cu permease
MPNKLPKKPPKSKSSKKFDAIADKVSGVVGSPYWFIFSVLIILIWFPSGLFIGFNEIWHLHINTTTTILTFLMVALLHSSQRRWEDKMERLQQRESTEIKAIEKTTKKIAYDSGETPINKSTIEKEEKEKELINSLK